MMRLLGELPTCPERCEDGDKGGWGRQAPCGAADNNAAPRAQGGRDQATMAMNIANEVMKTLVAWLPLGPA